jgi:tetratricopeptide (TPR) repeat protein
MTRLEQLQSFLEEDPNDPFLKYAIATEYKSMNKLEEALACFYSLLETNPDYVATYYHLGKTLETLNRNEEAIKIYEQGIQVAMKMKDHHSARELREALQQLTF